MIPRNDLTNAGCRTGTPLRCAPFLPQLQALNLSEIMTSEEIEARVREHLLDEALEDLEQYGRYWNGSISRTLAPTLKKLLETSGYPEIRMREIPPDWEFVYYLGEDSEVIEQVAIQRSLFKETNFDYSNGDLPK